jgi:hypothetical protein
MSLAGTRPARTERPHLYQFWESPSSKPLILPRLVVAVSPMGCFCGAVAVTSPLSLGDGARPALGPMSYWLLTGPNPQNNISR